MESNPKSQFHGEKICYQLNFSTSLGGAEIYTRFFSKALLATGWRTVLYVNEKAGFWRELDLASVTLVSMKRREDLPRHLPAERSLVVTHTPLPGPVADKLRQEHILTGIIHHPIYGGNGEPYRAYQLLFPVSKHVIDTLDAARIAHYHPEPLYGVADLDRLMRRSDRPLEAAPMYDWDKRKLRDRVLRFIYPLYWKLKPAQRFSRKEGLTLGIVSRIADAKQFPALFKTLSPILKRYPQVHIEIFGSGVGYSSIKRLKRSLAPIKSQIRFWGPQTDVGQIYRSVDFLLAGLPEREAMGLNILEAQFCGTPVLAVRARPFTEIVDDGKTGFLFTDPRLDHGKDFAALLDRLSQSRTKPDPLQDQAFLDAFRFESFSQRVDRILSHAMDHHSST